MGLMISLLNWAGSVPLWYYPVLLLTPIAILFFYASLLDYNPLVNRIIFNYVASEIILGRESISFKHVKGLQIIHKFEQNTGRYGPASGDYYGIQILCEGSEDLDLAFHYIFQWSNKEEDVTTTEDQIGMITQLGEFLLSLMPMTNRSTIPFKRNVLECDPKYSRHQDYSHMYIFAEKPPQLEHKKMNLSNAE